MVGSASKGGKYMLYTEQSDHFSND